MGIKHKIHIMMYKLALPIYYTYINARYSKVVYLIGTEDYGNLGDNHISFSENEFIEKTLGNCHIEEIPASKFDYYFDTTKKYIRINDIICMQGGGNIGNEYIAEYKRRKVLLQLPDNDIIVFPQTIYFTDNEEGKRELGNTINIFNDHKHLHLFIREKYSYDFVQNNFDVDVHLVPDIVLSSSYDSSDNRKGITLCLRHDIERKITDEDEKNIIDCAKRYRDKVEISDTQLSYHVSVKNRRNELDKIINKIRTSELVITDRLHGMVFCAITGTPCIVMSNYNKKVIGVYEWIKDLKYITFIDDLTQLDSKVNEMLAINRLDCIFPKEEISQKFDALRETLTQCWN